MFEVRQGDCVELMAAMPAGSVDAVVCDPPYHLAFMGRSWDTVTPGQSQREHERWALEALRVLKPGGHLLAFGGTRTYHRLASGIEDAGFEIRDTICWLYGSGFPKSLDVSKAIDRANGKHDRDLAPFGQFVRQAREAKGWSLRQLDEAMGTNTAASWWEGRKSGVQPPGVEMYVRLKGVLGLDDRFDELVEWAEAEREVTGVGGRSGKVRSAMAGDFAGEWDSTAPATPEAERWEGWGTALKPAHEPVVVARKPLSGTVAGNVLEHGTGALNVDGCRIDHDEQSAAWVEKWSGHDGHPDDSPTHGTGIGNQFGGSPAGRWPANVVLSHMEECVPVGTRKVKGSRIDKPYEGDAGPGYKRDFPTAERGPRGIGDPDGTETVEAYRCHPDCPVRLLDEQTGETTAWGGPRHNTAEAHNRTQSMGQSSADWRTNGYADSGGASRFFYCAKSSRGERNAGLEGFEERGTHEGGRVDGEGGMGTWDRKSRNSHPTVKPISLMRWLVRLVTPLGGTVLDPFTGSGTTGCAAVLEGFDFVGLEREAEYVKIAEARIGWWHKHRGDGEAAEILAAGELRDSVEATGQLGMFD